LPEPTGSNPADLDFEQAVEAVEKIIEKIESGEVGLEQSIAEYERGVALIRRCRQVLERAEQRVEELTGQMQADAATRATDAKGEGSRPTGTEPSR
jgi:exodeoxyribonuclease VII small subunit